MKKVLLFSLLLVAGMAGSQTLPGVLAAEVLPSVKFAIQLLTMLGLSFIMIHVGYEFEIDRSNLGKYGWDYVVAMTAAAFPWIFASAYFSFAILPAGAWGDWQAWKESLLAGRFAAPTSAGVLFSMLAAAGLGASWLFRKAQVLAIFDDIDTVLLLIPLQMMIVGLRWQLLVALVAMGGLLFLGWWRFRGVAVPVTWPWVLGYAAAITAACEGTLLASRLFYEIPIQVEVLLPAFVVGCLLKRGPHDPHRDDAREGHQDGPPESGEQRVATIISAVFMVCVGLSMPYLFGSAQGEAAEGLELSARTVSESQPFPGWTAIAIHVLVLTVLVNLGKMFPALCYRREASLRERLALAIGMWPRGEVGAGVLIVSLGYHLGGPMITVSMLCLALNLVLTGVFIYVVKWLLADMPAFGRARRG